VVQNEVLFVVKTKIYRKNVTNGLHASWVGLAISDTFNNSFSQNLSDEVQLTLSY